MKQSFQSRIPSSHLLSHYTLLYHLQRRQLHPLRHLKSRVTRPEPRSWTSLISNLSCTETSFGSDLPSGLDASSNRRKQLSFDHLVGIRVRRYASFIYGTLFVTYRMRDLGLAL